LQYAQWWLDDGNGWSRNEVEEAAVHGRDVIAKLKGCEDRKTAGVLKGRHVGVPRGALPESSAGEYYWTDLVGLSVKNLRGERLGRVAGLLSTGVHDVLRVEGERERLIPFVEAYVVSVDLSSGELLVDWGVDY
jgi:16S rRNA processing protein RimM